MTVKEMLERKRELGLTNEMIAQKSGVPLATVQKIFAGITKAPRRDTIRKLELLFSLREIPPQTDGSGFSGTFSDASSEALHIAESVLPYGTPCPRAYTLEDYYALPEGRRAELINGVFYDMAAPSRIHQLILLQLAYQFVPCVEEHPECELYVAPCDVCLNQDDSTIVQPDLFIACGKEDRDLSRFNGPPDFIIEILSPSSRSHDLFRKLNLYRFSGVREYWIIDPDNLKILTYDLEHDTLPERYTFQDTVPVLISEGKCRIRFSQILRKIQPYLD